MHGKIVAEYFAHSIYRLYSAEVLTFRDIDYTGEIFLVFCQFYYVLRAAICEVYVLNAVIITRVGMRIYNAVELELFGCFAVGYRNLTKRHDLTGATQTYLGG